MGTGNPLGVPVPIFDFARTTPDGVVHGTQYGSWVAHTSVMCGWRQPQDVFRISFDFEKIFILQFRKKSSCAFSAPQGPPNPSSLPGHTCIAIVSSPLGFMMSRLRRNITLPTYSIIKERPRFPQSKKTRAQKQMGIGL